MQDRGRLTIPVEVRRRISWLAPLPHHVLASIDPEGGVEILPWEKLGEGLIQNEMERLNALDEPAKGTLAVALADKYFRLSLEEPARIGLTAGLRSFLGAHGDQPVRLVCLHQQLWLWNEKFWQRGRGEREALIA